MQMLFKAIPHNWTRAICEQILRADKARFCGNTWCITVKSQQSQEAYALFPLGGIVLGLYPLQELEKDTTLNYQQASFSGMTISYNATSEEEVDTVMQEAERLGATVVKPAQKVFWGGYSGYFKDLDGYVFEVAYNPFWEIDSEGSLVM